MLVELRGVLGGGVVAALAEILKAAPFSSGASTAAPGALTIKNNLQLASNHPLAIEGAQRVARELGAHSLFQAATLASAVTPPRFCRYEKGMAYGDHQDSPFMGGARRLRTDIAVTISLADRSSYEGGELVIDSDGASHAWKGNAGDCIIYPANTLHRVEPVRDGARAVAILWIQSIVREPARRRVLFDLFAAGEALDREGSAPAEIARLRECYGHLLRMWSEI
jgi:PKHD-type hydroxylase